MVNNIYESKDVVVTRGVAAAKEAVANRDMGFSPNDVDKMMAFADEIIEVAKGKGLSPAVTFTALVNAITAIILSTEKSFQTVLVGCVTEALFAVTKDTDDASS